MIDTLMSDPKCLITKILHMLVHVTASISLGWLGYRLSDDYPFAVSTRVYPATDVSLANASYAKCRCTAILQSDQRNPHILMSTSNPKVMSRV